MSATIERPASDAMVASPPDQGGLTPETLATLESIERRLLWLSTQIIHHANNVRPNPDKSKVGGHQASSASVATILTALYFSFLRPGTASRSNRTPPRLPRRAIPARPPRPLLFADAASVRWPQAYPSRTKDPDQVDFSTGSVGLGAVAPVFAAQAARYARTRFGEVSSDRFVALIGDAELDEGNVWEAVAEEAIQGLGNVIWIIDLNRQSLDRVIPGVRAARLKALFASAGWKVFEAKYGSRLEAAMREPGGDALRRRIDEMSNEEYQALIRLRDGANCAAAWPTSPMRLRRRRSCSRSPRSPMRTCPGSSPTSPVTTCRACSKCWAKPTPLRTPRSSSSPTPSRGFGLPLAGDPLNHSMLLTQTQMDELRAHLGVPEDDIWAAFPPDSPEGLLCAERARPFRAADRDRAAASRLGHPGEPRRHPPRR